MEYKTCTKCLEEKPLFEFRKYYRGKKAFYRGECKGCHNMMERERYYKNEELRENAKTRKKIWYETNPNKHKEYSQRFREKNRERYNQLQRKWSKSNSRKVNHIQKKSCQKLSDGYVKGKLRSRHDVPTSKITPDIIEFYRLQLQLKRKIKQKKEESCNQ